jgi:hypothetical protein
MTPPPRLYAVINLPAHIARRQYDLVFANSVIEHVGGHERRERFADSVHQLSDSYRGQRHPEVAYRIPDR